MLAFLLAATLVRTVAVPDTTPSDSLSAKAELIYRRMDGSVDFARIFAPTPERQDTLRTRTRTPAFEYSDGYHKRLKLHQILSFTMIPLFIGSYVTGNRLIKDGGAAPDWARRLHSPFATGTAIVFTANTITGILNLIESNKDPNGRTKRWIHSVSMMVADAGFTYGGTKLAADAQLDPAKRGAHRDVLLASMGISVASWASMLFLK